MAAQCPGVGHGLFLSVRFPQDSQPLSLSLTLDPDTGGSQVKGGLTNLTWGEPVAFHILLQ